jgi:hypothetical protein
MFAQYSLEAQNTGILWMNGHNHQLGVKYFQQISGDAVFSDSEYGDSVKDTFIFRNLTGDTLVLHQKEYSRFSHSLQVAPGETGYIWFNNVHYKHAKKASLVSDSVKIWDKSGSVLEVKLEYIVVYSDLATLQKNPGKSPPLIFKDEGGREKILAFHSNNKPAYLGQRLQSGYTKVGRWKYWTSVGEPLMDTLFTKELVFSIAEGDKYVGLEFLIYKNGKWQPALKGRTESQWSKKYSLYIYPGTDSLLITNGSVSAKEPLSYDRLFDRNEKDPIYLMTPDQLYIVRRGYKKPVYLVKDEYALFLKKMPNKMFVEYVDHLKQKYPELSFTYYKKYDLLRYIDLRNVKHPDTFYLHQLEKETNVLYISKLYDDDDYKSAYAFEVQIQFQEGYTLDSLMAALKDHPFRYSHIDLYSSRPVVVYTNGKLLDENYFMALNRLLTEPCVKWINMESLRVIYKE